MQIKNFQHRQECRWQGQVKINFYNQHYATNAVSELNPVYSFYSLTHAAFFSILHIFHFTFFLSCLSVFFISLSMYGRVCVVTYVMMQNWSKNLGPDTSMPPLLLSPAQRERGFVGLCECADSFIWPRANNIHAASTYEAFSSTNTVLFWYYTQH